MKRMIILAIVVIGFCFGLLAQPKAFDPKYYRDSLKVQKSVEFKKLEKYREKYKDIGLPFLETTADPNNQYYHSDYFYHMRINLGKIDEYRKIGLFRDKREYNDKWYRSWMNDAHDRILRPVIVIAKLLSFERKFAHDDVSEFEILRIIKGREYYDQFPSVIKCYSILGKGSILLSSESAIASYSQLQGGIALPEKNEKGEVVLEEYFGRFNPVTGDEFVLYLDVYERDYVDLDHKDKNEFDRIDVFYHIEADYLDYITHDIIEKNKSEAQVILARISKKLKVIDEFKLNEGKND